MATYRERNGRWQVRVVASDGRQVARTFKTKTVAKQWATEAEADLLRGVWVNPRAGETLFRDYAEGWIAERRARLAPGTWKRDESYLRSLILPTFGDQRVGSIRVSDVSGWLAALKVKESTAAKALQIVSGVLERARRDRAIPTNPVRDIPARPNPKRTRRPGRALSDAELSRVLNAAWEVDEARALVVVVMARLGLRIGEALALRASDFDVTSRMVTIARTRSKDDGAPRPLKQRVKGECRVIPVPGDTWEAFERTMAMWRPPRRSGGVVSLGDDDLFVSSRATPLLYRNWRRAWSRIVREARVGHVVPHDLRHTCITRLFLVDRWSPAEVQAYVGHSDARITLEVYSHVNPAELPMPSTLRSKVGHG